MIQSLEHLRSLAGQEVATSDWLEVTQERINQFAQATSDPQWIHVDPERARRESPYGTTIAHGFLTLSLLVPMSSVIRVPGIRLGVNYGTDKVRFPAPVPAGSKIRARFTLRALEDLPGNVVKASWSATVEREGGSKPVCAADWTVLYYL
jgi:acyl dehydratase